MSTVKTERAAAALRQLFDSAEAKRRARAEEIARKGEIEALKVAAEGDAVCVSASSHGYAVQIEVRPGETRATCTCPDAQKRGGVCKHVAAVALVVAEGLEKGTITLTLAPSATPTPAPREQIAAAVNAAVEALAQKLADALREPDAEPILLLGPSGCGKTAAVRRAAELLGAGLEEVQLAPSWTDADLLGIRTQQVTYVGPLARAFARALVEGSTVMVFLDEFLRAPQRVQDGLMRAFLPVPPAAARGMGIPADAPVAVAEAPLFGRIHAPWARVKWVAAANPWGSALDPALLDRVRVWRVGFERQVLDVLPERTRQLVEYSWRAAEEGELPLAVSYRSLLRERLDADELRQAWLARLRLLDAPAADVAAGATEGLV